MPMTTVNRRHAREWALQILFQIDANPSQDLAPVLRDFWIQQLHVRQDEGPDGSPDAAAASLLLEAEAAADLLAPRRYRAFTEHLVRGVAENLGAIDERLVRYTEHWPLHRMGGVDRNVLRLAIYEMFFDDQAPPVVIINEAVDLAKFFSSSESGRFVNGILDRACKDVTRPPRESAPDAGGGRAGRGKTRRRRPAAETAAVSKPVA